MAQRYRQFLMHTDVHDDLDTIRLAVSELIGGSPGIVGLSGMVRLMLEHWKEHTPPVEWTKQKMKFLPLRGRPRVSSPKDLPAIHGRGLRRGEHTFLVPRGKPEFMVCKWCCTTRDHGHLVLGLNSCWKTGGTSYPVEWKKSQLLAMGFQADEVEWAHDED